MSFTIKLRRDTKVRWITSELVLAEGEPGYESDTGRFKIGNGVARWLDLEYFYPGLNAIPNDDSAAIEALQAHINSLTPHSIYDDGPSLLLLYKNAKV